MKVETNTTHRELIQIAAEKIVNEIDNGCNVVGAIADLTGSTFDQPTRGVNFCVFFIAKDVTDAELQQYANKVFAEEA